MMMQITGKNDGKAKQSAYRIIGSLSPLQLTVLRFCAAVADYAVNNITFAHEIGHLLGGRHQFALDDDGTFNHGYYHHDETPSNRWRTVMAIYDDKHGDTDTRIPYWSTPHAYYASSPRGDQNSIMTSQLENYSPTVATFSPHMVSGTISTNTTWTENSHMSGNVTVANGATLTISPGLSITSLGPYKLRVEGKLVANGNPNNQITFTRSGGQWYGIEFYYNCGNGSSIQYAKIENAQYGISNYGTDAYFANNQIRYNLTGVYVNGSINSMNWNLFQYNTYGVQCANYGDANIQTNNVIRYNSWGVSGDYSSAPALGSYIGYNSLYSNDYYDVYSNYSGTIYARGNWWGQNPAYPSVTVNVDYSEHLVSESCRITREPPGKSVVAEVFITSRYGRHEGTG